VSAQIITVRFPVTPEALGRAMALTARDHDPIADLPDGNDFTDEAPEYAEYVRGMSKTAALRALRECYHAYGELSWPDDYPHEAYRAGVERARAWIETGALA